MPTPYPPPTELLAEQTRRFSIWGIVAGALATITGVLCLIWPKHSVSAVALLLAAFLVVTGVVTLILGLRRRGTPGGSGGITTGVVSLVLGLLIAVHPGMSGRLIVIFMGLAVLLIGVLLFVISLAMRAVTGKWLKLLSLSALVCLVVGLIFAISPGFGATALGVLLGVGAMLAGVTLVAAGVQTRRLGAGAADGGSLGAQGVVIEGTVVDTPGDPEQFRNRIGR